MMKKIFKGLFVVLICIVFIPNVMAKEETLGDLRKTYNDLLAEKRANDNKTAAAKAEIAKKEEETKQAEKDISNAENEQQEAEQAIEESNENIENLKLESEKVLLYMQQMQSKNVYVEYVTGASTMTEMIMRMEAVNQVTAYIQTTTKNLEEEIARNEKLRLELIEKQENLKKQIAIYQERIKNLYTNIDEYDKFALSIDDKVKMAKENLDANVKICKENLGKTDDNVKISDCSKVPVNGGWLKPLTSGVITSTIGTRWGSYHNALDIGGNAEGTKIFAAAAGRVAGIAERTSCGGNRVYIYVNVNGHQYTTFYYHLLKINVKVGDIVDQNTVIGTVGGGRSTSAAYGGYDTCTTGAHLHYGVADGWYAYHVTKNIITPPGFPNREGYRFSSRFDFYNG
ncbi:MAG: peptidoglycan DD-metalloendopeptidase family protein [Ruminococcus sp.]|nr:peptidoglycan DD-metalloendopeptidase family protein [Ruminococcus sp.]